MRLVAVALVAGAVGVSACEGSSHHARRAARSSGPCVEQARAAVLRASGRAAVTTRTTGVSAGLATCVYESPRLRVDAMVDANPQAAVRFDRAVVERDQVAVWSHRHERAPRLLNGIGQGADWFPADRQLLATDGRRIVSVTLARSSLAPRAQLRLGETVARATLRHAR